MNRVLLLILIAGLTFLVILFFSRADLANNFWLWVVGLAGPLYKSVDMLFAKIKSLFLQPKEEDKPDENAQVVNEQ